jgi:hypothetical protein
MKMGWPGKSSEDYVTRLIKAVMTSALVKSIKNAPTANEQHHCCQCQRLYHIESKDDRVHVPHGRRDGVKEDPGFLNR